MKDYFMERMRAMTPNNDFVPHVIDEHNRVKRNNYGAAVLESQTLPIIDCDVREGVSDADIWERIFFLSGQYELGFRIYQTHAGYRVILPNKTQVVDKDVLCLMTSLFADPDYIEACRISKTYRARLTSKPWRDGISAQRIAVCRFIDVVGKSDIEGVHWPTIDYHDRFTAANSGIFVLA